MNFSQNSCFYQNFNEKLAKYANKYANKIFWANMHENPKNSKYAKRIYLHLLHSLSNDPRGDLLLFISLHFVTGAWPPKNF